MAKINEVKQSLTKIALGGVERTLIFDFNALGLIEEIHGDIDKTFASMGEGTGKFKTIRDLTWAGMSHELMDMETGVMALSRFQVGALLELDSGQIETIAKAITEAFYKSMPDEQKKAVDAEVAALNAPATKEEQESLSK